MKGWYAAFLALAWAAPAAGAPPGPAQDLNGAARDLARKTAALAGAGEAVAVRWRDLSSLGSAALDQARAAFENGLRESGGRLSEAVPAVEAQITISENQSQYLLVEETRKGDDRQVWIASWPRGEAAPANTPSATVTLSSRLLWEQDQPVLDVAAEQPAGAVLILSPSGLTRTGSQPETAAIPPLKPWPRDPRGRLRRNGGAVQVSLPGMACGGTANGALALSCHAGDELWTLESGRALLLAAFAPGRNYFDGRVVAQSGARKTLPPFYSAAATDDGGRPLWILATVEGPAQIFDASLEPVGAINSWGSDIAGLDLHCGGHALVLATRPGDVREPDAIRAFTVLNRAAVAMGPAAELPGPVTALWPAGPASATAVVRNLATGKYQAYAVAVACGQ